MIIVSLHACMRCSQRIILFEVVIVVHKLLYVKFYTFLHYKYIIYDRVIIPALLAIMPAQVYVCWHIAPIKA